MKHYGRAFLLALGLTGALTVGAMAADYEAAAQELAQIGILKGNAQGFDLDRAPTRTEASVMLVRLLGGEEEALAQFAAGKIEHPFCDVKDWANPYVAWLYKEGLVQGMTATDGTLYFGGTDSDVCTAQMYTTFLLRALSYRDSGAKTDFTFAEVLDFAQSLGVYDASQMQGSFLRDDLAALTLQALTVNPRKGSDSLLESLIDQGAISRTEASDLRKTVRNYRAWREDNARQAKQSDWDMTLTLDMQTGDSVTTTTMQLCTQEQADGSLAVASTTQMETSLGFVATLSQWWKDGWQYTQAGSSRTKTAVTSAVGAQDWSVEPLYLYQSIQRTTDSSGTQYGIELSPVATRALASFGTANLSVSTPIAMETQFGRDDTIQRSVLRFAQTVEGSTATVELCCDYTACGEEVEIDWPDFSQFVLQ